MSEQRKKIIQKKVKKMAPKNVVGTIVIKKVTDDQASVSTGNTSEKKIRCTGELGIGDEYLADIESFTFKGAPENIKQLMKALNLDVIDESTKITIHKNLQTRLDTEPDE